MPLPTSWIAACQTALADGMADRHGGLCDAPEAAAGSVPASDPFYIPATGAASRPRRTLKHNDTFAVFDSHGDIGAIRAADRTACSTATRAISRTSSC